MWSNKPRSQPPRSKTAIKTNPFLPPTEISPPPPTTITTSPAPIHHHPPSNKNLTLIGSSITQFNNLPNYNLGLPDTLLTLNLHCNDISTLTGLSMLSQLIELNLSSNCIEIMDASEFSSLNKLKRLNLASNNIKRVGGLSNLIQLEELNVSHNRITSLGGLNQLTSQHVLHTLDLRDNRILNLIELTGLTTKCLTLQTVRMKSDAAHNSQARRSVRNVRKQEGNVVCTQLGYVAALRTFAPNIQRIDEKSVKEAEHMEIQIQKKIEIEQQEEQEQEEQEQEDMEPVSTSTSLTTSLLQHVASSNINPYGTKKEDQQLQNIQKIQKIKAARHQTSKTKKKKKDLIATPAIDRAQKMRLLKLQRLEKEKKDKKENCSNKNYSKQQQQQRQQRNLKKQRSMNTATTATPPASNQVLLESKRKRIQSKKRQRTYEEEIDRLKQGLLRAKEMNHTLSSRNHNENEDQKKQLLYQLDQKNSENLVLNQKLKEIQLKYENNQQQNVTTATKEKEMSQQINVLQKKHLNDQTHWEERLISAVQTATNTTILNCRSINAKEIIEMREKQKQHIQQCAVETTVTLNALNEKVMGLKKKNITLELTMDEMSKMHEARIEDVHNEWKIKCKDTQQTDLLKHQELEFEQKQKHIHMEKQIIELTTSLSTTKNTVERTAIQSQSLKQALEQAQQLNQTHVQTIALLETSMATKENNYQLLQSQNQKNEDLEKERKTNKNQMIQTNINLKHQYQTTLDTLLQLRSENDNGKLNFQTLKLGFETATKETSQLKTALASATDVVRRQKDVLRRQASEAVTMRRKVEQVHVLEERVEQQKETLKTTLHTCHLKEMELQQQLQQQLTNYELERQKKEQHTTLALLSSSKQCKELELKLQNHANEIIQSELTSKTQLQHLKSQLEAENDIWKKKEVLNHQNNVIQLKTNLQIKEKQIDDTNETNKTLKFDLKKEQDKRKEAEERVERRNHYKHDLRDVEDEKDDLLKEYNQLNAKRKNEKLSFDNIRGHLEAIIEEQTEELQQHVTNNVNSEKLRLELINKDETIRNIEQQVLELSEMSLTYKQHQIEMTSIKELYTTLQTSYNVLKKKTSSYDTKRILLEGTVEELKSTNETATAMVRSMKAEMVRKERSVKDLEEDVNRNTVLIRNQKVNIHNLQNENKELKKKGKQTKMILDQLNNL